MVHVRYCILGAGPSGLTFANKLKQAGITSFVLLDKEASPAACVGRRVNQTSLGDTLDHLLPELLLAELDTHNSRTRLQTTYSKVPFLRD